jgi:hypothetical protein
MPFPDIPFIHERQQCWCVFSAAATSSKLPMRAIPSEELEHAS